VDKVQSILGPDLAGQRIAAWGLSFKPNTDDIREAPQIAVVQALVKLGAQVQAYDPVAMDNARRVLTGVDFCSNAYEAAAGADAVLLLTEWNEFKQIDLARVLSSLRRPVLIDGRNMFVPAEMRAQGFEYASVGRP
jgi:UDPglucose 6-dehydrogenase